MATEPRKSYTLAEAEELLASRTDDAELLEEEAASARRAAEEVEEAISDFKAGKPADIDGFRIVADAPTTGLPVPIAAVKRLTQLAVSIGGPSALKVAVHTFFVGTAAEVNP